jgi:hypothetical membrane protein
MSKILKNNSRLILLSFILIFISVYFSYYTGFSWVKDSLSDFGLVSHFFNFSLIVSGIALGVFTLLVIDREHSRGLCRLFLLFSSIFLTFIGIFTKEYLIHFVFAILFFATFPSGLFFLGRNLQKDNYELGIATKSVGLILMFIWLLFFGIWLFVFKFGLAIPEIVSLSVCMIWVFYFIYKFKH